MYGWTGLGVLLLRSWMARLGVLDDSRGLGTANTALHYHAGKLMAVHEGDLPYAVRPNDEIEMC